MRRERDITQETLAEYLGVSSKAVSQWENLKTMPDISQLPVLANVFGVTVDELLGVDVHAKEKRIEEYCRRGEDALAGGKKKESIVILREGLVKYPDSHKLMVKLASHLYCSCSSDEAGEEIAALLDKVLADCTDTVVRNEAILLACRLYPKIGRQKEAIRLAESMEGAAGRLELLPEILKGKAQFAAYRDCTFKHVNDVLSSMFYYAGLQDEDKNYFFTAKEGLVIYEKILACADIFFEESDYMYEAQIVEKAAEEAARICAAAGDVDNALRYAEKCANGCIQFDTYDWNAVHMSLLWRGFVFGGYYVGEHNHSHDMAERFEKEEAFAVLRGHTEFDRILGRLRAAAE